MIHHFYKCTECEIGPCHMFSEHGVIDCGYGQTELERPNYCPHAAETAKWKLCMAYIPDFGRRYQQLLDEFSEHYDELDPQVRDLIFTSRLSCSWPYGLQYKMQKILLYFDEFRDSQWFGDVHDLDPQKDLEKYKKREIAVACFGRGLEVGLILAEMRRHGFVIFEPNADED